MAELTSVLVTGAAGFVGRRLVHFLRGRGHRVACLDLVDGQDVRSASDVRPLVPEGGWVFHLASVVGVVEVLRRPEETWTTSVDGTRVVCEAARDRGARVVFASSSEVYGDGSGTPLGEQRPLPADYGAWPRAAYPAGKRAAEELVQRFVRGGGDGRIARLFNVAGPGQSSAAGMVLPTFVEHALAGRPLPLIGDGSDVRCFQHVDDAVAGLYALAGARDVRGAVLNLGGNEPIDMHALAEHVCRTLGCPLSIRWVSDRERYGGATLRCRHRVPDLSQAIATLGHHPGRDLTRIIRDLAGTAHQRPAEALRPRASSRFAPAPRTDSLPIAHLRASAVTPEVV